MNALAKETSPYLLQHAHNPVEWYPWGSEALRRAREEDRPILLSIGYSACHWCHVMERESFENEHIARIMNEHFINIKVDREERPELDSIYMSAVQAMTGSGGWPMTVFLMPEGIPFYGGTYFPPEDRYGMPGFPRVLLSVAAAYREKKDLIRKDAERVMEELRRGGLSSIAGGELNSKILDKAVASLVAYYDPEHGGFGDAPKFPSSMALSFLLRTFLRTGENRLLEIVEHSLRAMAFGGIYDQLGGGFHRYSVDRFWLVPHFEKMLYDNALLCRLYLEAYLQTKHELYRRIAEETLEYVRREMTSPEGGFYSTQDADSEGREGKFFLWTPDEVTAVLGEKEGGLFCRYYNITSMGNFEGKNILHIQNEIGAGARQCNVTELEMRQIVVRGRKRLFEEREKRIKPARDEKVLTSWNGLMLRSFAEAAAALDREDYLETAIRNAEFLVSQLQRDHRVMRSWKDGVARVSGYLEDYACLVDALLSLYEVTFSVRWLDEAVRLAGVLVEEFRDPARGDFYLTSRHHETLIHRPKDYYDNATPSGNSVAAFALLRLAELTGENRWVEPARTVLSVMATVMARNPSAFSNYLSALDFLLSGPREIAILGDPSDARTRGLLRQVYKRYLPNKVVVCGTGDTLDLLKGRTQIDNLPTAYVCRNRVCKLPVTSPEELGAQLAGE